MGRTRSLNILKQEYIMRINKYDPNKFIYLVIYPCQLAITVGLNDHGKFPGYEVKIEFNCEKYLLFGS